jgi:hypothetical protein
MKVLDFMAKVLGELDESLGLFGKSPWRIGPESVENRI